jgi:dihydroorotase
VEAIYDLIIANGTVLDPASGLHGPSALALADGRIAARGEDVCAEQGRAVLDATGCLVVPGLIDLHTHVFADVSMFGIEADDLCPRTGVTTAIDTGSAGWINFRGFERYVIERSETRILGYVNLSGVGLPW